MKIEEYENLCIDYTYNLKNGEFKEKDYELIKKTTEEFTKKYLESNCFTPNEFVTIVANGIIATSKTLDYFVNTKNQEKYSEVLGDMATLFKPLN